MNWDALGAIAELLGAIAVLATLLYLARQIKESSKAQTLSTYNSFIDGYMRLNEWLTETPERSSLTLMILEERKERDLTEIESLQLNMILRNVGNHLLRMLRLYEAGTIQENDWHNFAGEARQVFNATKYGREFKENNFAFSDLWDQLEKIEVDSVSEFTSSGKA